MAWHSSYETFVGVAGNLERFRSEGFVDIVIVYFDILTHFKLFDICRTFLAGSVKNLFCFRVYGNVYLFEFEKR